MNSNTIAKQNKLILSATYDADSFFYCLWGDKNTLLQHGDYDHYLAHQDQYTEAIYTVSYNGLPFTHVPSEEHNEEYNLSYLQNMSRLYSCDNWVLKSNAIDNCDIVSVFAFQLKHLSSFDLLKHAKGLKHSSESIIWASLKYIKEHTSVFLHIGEKHFSITVAKKGNLILHNQYAFKAAEDVLYYVCLIYDQLSLDRNVHPLLLSGNIAEKSPLYNMIFTYIREVSFVNLYFDQDEDIEKPKHYFFDHFALALCA